MKKGKKKNKKGKGGEQHPKEKKNDVREPETNMEAEQHPNEKKIDEREPETNMETASSGIENEDVGVKAEETEETKTESPQAPGRAGLEVFERMPKLRYTVFKF